MTTITIENAGTLLETQEISLADFNSFLAGQAATALADKEAAVAQAVSDTRTDATSVKLTPNLGLYIKHEDMMGRRKAETYVAAMKKGKEPTSVLTNGSAVNLNSGQWEILLGGDDHGRATVVTCLRDNGYVVLATTLEYVGTLEERKLDRNAFRVEAQRRVDVAIVAAQSAATDDETDEEYAERTGK